MAHRKIKILKAIRFDYTIQSFKDEDISIIENPAFLREYDKNSNLISEIIYGLDGNISEKYAYVYAHGKMTEQIVYMDEDTIAEHKFFEYEGDRIIKQIIKYQESEDKTLWTYDNEGRIMSKITIDQEDGEESQKIIYNYTHNKVHIQTYDTGTLESEVWDTLNDKGKVIERISHDIEEGVKTITSYTYTDIGELASEIEKTIDGKLIKSIENEYNDKGQLAFVNTKDLSSITKLAITYDDFGNEISQQEINEKGEINHRVDRKFDKDGNLLEAKVMVFYHGQGMDSQYQINYDYEFYED